MDRQYRTLQFCLIMLSLFPLVLLPSRESSALSDDLLTQRIEEEATNTSELAGTQVRVSVEDGLVVLSGTVPLYAQKLLYKKIAWQTLGVAEVEDEIRVLPLFPVEDAAIEAAIQDILKTSPRLQGMEIKIRVEEGTVTLEGTFQHPRIVVFLKHKVAALEGVVAIQIHAQFNV